MRKVLFIVFTMAGLGLLYNNCSTLEKVDYGIERDPANVPREVQDLYQRFVDNNFFDQNLSIGDNYESFLQKFNETQASTLTNDDDWIDAFVGSLPDRVRRHYTFVHRSYSIQSGTPMSPRVILFTPDARTIMTFNSPLDENGNNLSDATGTDKIEVIQWNVNDLAWDFAELDFTNGQAVATKNPQRCVMCHAGTPKPILAEHSDFYQGKLKPIFPQYPLWPGFYGSINDIVAKDRGIGATEAETFEHVRGFLFGDSEELSRLRSAFDNNEKYKDVVRNEIEIHQNHFFNFMESMPERPRYKHLIPLTDLYTKQGDNVPNFLGSAPFRQSFAKKYGHYILRPNFFLSSLMSFYHAQAVAREIYSFPEYDRIKYSFLAAKFNCDGAYDLRSGDLKLTDLNPSFDLIYPNVASQASRDKQYLLAYQYNLVHDEKTKQAGNHVPALPLFSWNLEGNEDIASYHYGNVFSDLNEIVLWNLAAEAFEEIDIEDGRDGQEARHADFNVRNHLNKNTEEIELFKRT